MNYTTKMMMEIKMVETKNMKMTKTLETVMTKTLHTKKLYSSCVQRSQHLWKLETRQHLPAKCLLMPTKNRKPSHER